MLDISPLSIINKRELRWMPPHFSKFNLENDWTLDNHTLKRWVQYKLKGRFCMIETDPKTITIGFEDEKELTYFVLACPHIRR